MGTRADIVHLCARSGTAADDSRRYAMIEPKWQCSADATDVQGGPETQVVQCGEGGAVTQWRDGACLYVNAGRYRNGPSARYRNRFWREPDGSVRMSWFPGRGHTLQSAAITRLLTSTQQLLLFCRRAPSAPYYLCGRLQPAATAQPINSGRGVNENGGGSGEGSGSGLLPCWTIDANSCVPAQDGNAPNAHVIFQVTSDLSPA